MERLQDNLVCALLLTGIQTKILVGLVLNRVEQLSNHHLCLPILRLFDLDPSLLRFVLG